VGQFFKLTHHYRSSLKVGEFHANDPIVGNNVGSEQIRWPKPGLGSDRSAGCWRPVAFARASRSA